jgi:foldase protein PrsA
MVKIQEVLVASKEEGDKLAKQIRAGADLARIARQHTLRPGMKEKGGVLDSITTSNSAILFEAVKGAKKGQIVGPVPFRDKFSVIKLLERTPSKQLKFEEVQPRLRGLAYEDKKKSVFDNWIEARKRVDQVEVYPDLYWQKVSEKLAALMASRPQGSRQSIKGQLPLKIKVGPEGKIEKVEDDSL